MQLCQLGLEERMDSAGKITNLNRERVLVNSHASGLLPASSNKPYLQEILGDTHVSTVGKEAVRHIRFRVGECSLQVGSAPPQVAMYPVGEPRVL